VKTPTKSDIVLPPCEEIAALAKALNLPPGTTKFTLNVDVDKPVTVECTYFVTVHDVRAFVGWMQEGKNIAHFVLTRTTAKAR
jgi:hypothetical protein